MDELGDGLTPDPSKEFSNPYIGMANNPTNVTDVDGGCTDCSRCPEACRKAGIINDDIKKDQSLDVISLKIVDQIITHLDQVVVVGRGSGQEARYNAWKDYYVQSLGEYRIWENAEIHRREFYAAREAYGRGVLTIIGVAISTNYYCGSWDFFRSPTCIQKWCYRCDWTADIKWRRCR